MILLDLNFFGRSTPAFINIIDKYGEQSYAIGCYTHLQQLWTYYYSCSQGALNAASNA